VGLLVPVQGNLFASGQVEVRPDVLFERIELGQGAWVDVARNWLGGADVVADRLIETVDWRHHRRRMYDRMVDEPRVSRWYRASEQLPDPALVSFRREVGRHYGIPFAAMGLNYYRDGSDSVAFHADRELKFLDETMVAILTFGATRPFLLRPALGGRSIDIAPASGDLLVMGGACQVRWEHGVPKVRRGSGPRVSASVRWARQGGPEREWAPADRLESP
jgi:alkylated DNA repair dioxygenase AlkB